MNPITQFSGKMVALPVDNIDTDQITPARFLKKIKKEGFGKLLFADWRYSDEFSPKPGFALNQPAAQGATILVAGDNFGCGSSREHAPWALVDYGFRAIVSTSFADIFQNNCLKNGLLPIVVDAAMHRETMAAAEKNLDAEVDLPRQTFTLPSGKSAGFPIDPFAKRCLVQGLDELGYILSHAAAIVAYEAAKSRRG